MKSTIKVVETPARTDYSAFLDEKGSLCVNNPLEKDEFINLTPFLLMLDSFSINEGLHYSATPIGLSERISDALETIIFAYESKSVLGGTEVEFLREIVFLQRLANMLGRMNAANQKPIDFEDIFQSPTLKQTA